MSRILKFNEGLLPSTKVVVPHDYQYVIGYTGYDKSGSYPVYTEPSEQGHLYDYYNEGDIIPYEDGKNMVGKSVARQDKFAPKPYIAESKYPSQKMVHSGDVKFPCTFSIMTKELKDRLNSKGISPIAYSTHGYSFMCESADELEKFKSEYKKGNKYNGETITGNAVFKFNVY